MRRRQSGLSLLEVTLALVVAAVLLTAGIGSIKQKRVREEAKATQQSAEAVLDALARFYLAHCKDASFPAVNLTVLQSEGFLPPGQSVRNSLGTTFWPAVTLGPPARISVTADVTKPGDMAVFAGETGASGFTSSPRRITWQQIPSLKSEALDASTYQYKSMYETTCQ